MSHMTKGERTEGPEEGAAPSPFSSVEEAIEEIRRGRMVVVCDDEARENEGDLTIAAQFATPEAINFMATHGRGLICLSLTPDAATARPEPMAAKQRSAAPDRLHGCRSRPAKGSPPGSRPHDRARTIQVAIDPRTSPHDLVQPGHVFPLRRQDGGVLERTGQTEAAVDLARLAGLNPAGVICEIMNDDGTMARRARPRRATASTTT